MDVGYMTAIMVASWLIFDSIRTVIGFLKWRHHANLRRKKLAKLKENSSK